MASSSTCITRFPDGYMETAKYYQLSKRLLDIVVALCGLAWTAPLLAVVAVLIKVRSPGPVFYRGIRVGLYGRPFRILKFRTMVVDAEVLGGSATADDDFRLTTFGRKLRKSKVDELPQLMNVLLGEMSLVGPRPEVQKYVDRYTEGERSILNLRPGLTDWATIWNSDEGAALAGSSDAERTYEEFIRPIKTKLQLLYTKNHSMAVDLKIIFHTGMKLLNKNWTPKEIAVHGTSTNLRASCRF
ncbi:MAG: sugar transferase [Bryobacteraceae bacterium]